MSLKLFQKTAMYLSVYAVLAAGALSAIPVAHAALQTPAIGKQAPSFDLPNVRSGEQTSLQSLISGKKATVVIFVSSRCWVCKAYEGRMADLAKKYGPEGFSFIGIDSNQTEPIAECASWSVTSKIGFPVLKDQNNVIADEYGATHTPEAYVINADGKLVYHGRIDSAIDPMGAQHHDLADALDDILSGTPIAVRETKAFGCSIKRVGE